jgi:hypothetical protein
MDSRLRGKTTGALKSHLRNKQKASAVADAFFTFAWQRKQST